MFCKACVDMRCFPVVMRTIFFADDIKIPENLCSFYISLLLGIAVDCVREMVLLSNTAGYDNI